MQSTIRLIIATAVLSSLLSSTITVALSNALNDTSSRPTASEAYAADRFVATKDGQRVATLAATSDGVGVMLGASRVPRVHLFAQDDGREGLAFYDRQGTLRASLFVQPDGVGALSFYGASGELQYRVPEGVGGPIRGGAMRTARTTKL